MSGKQYRINNGRIANIEVLDDTGKVTHKLCVHPSPMIPNEDTMLAQKLMLEYCEDELISKANRRVA